MEPKTNRETTPALDPLLRQAINNNREALDEIFARYRGRLYNTAFRLLGNSADAEDALPALCCRNCLDSLNSSIRPLSILH